MTTEANPYGTDAHPEVSEISDLTEGCLPVSRTQELRAHLTGCPLCADIHDSLKEIRNTLGTLPGPCRMPSDVAGRIDAALAAEALLDADRPSQVSRETSPRGSADVSRETTEAPAWRASLTPERTPGSTRPGSTRPSTRPGSTRRGSTGPAAGGPSSSSAGSGRPGRLDVRRNRRLRPLLTTAGVLGALVLGGALFQSLNNGSPDSQNTGRSATQESSSDGDGEAVADEGLERRVQALLNNGPAPETSKPGLTSETGQPEDTAPLVGGPTTVPLCVRAGIDRPEQPLAAESGRAYAGRPSYLVVLPHPGDPQRVDAYVVDSSCTTDAGSGPGEVLVEHTYQRD